MLILDMAVTLKETMEYGYPALGLAIDAGIYKFASILYALFYKLASAQLLSNDIYESLARRIYLFIGIIALFVMSVSLLRALVNPDEIGKGVIKSFKTLVTSIVLIVLMPTIFSLAYSLQGAIFENRVIDRIFNFDLEDTANKAVDTYGMDVSTLCNISPGQSYNLIVNNSDGSQNGKNVELSQSACYSNYMILTTLEGFFSPVSEGVENPYTTKYGIRVSPGAGYPDTMNTAREYMVLTGDFSYIRTFAKNVVSEPASNSVEYTSFISGAAGIALCIIILLFCFDIGVRCAKLAFLQIIAPIPILMRLVPKKEGQFDKWVSSTVSTYLDVFMKVMIITFVMFIARNLIVIFDSLNLGKDLSLAGKAVLVLGLFVFASQAPKLIKDLLGIEGDILGNVKTLGKGAKTAAGFGFGVGATVGAGASVGVKNLTNAFGKNRAQWASVKSATGFKNKMRAVGSASLGTVAGVGSVLGGTLSGAARAGSASLKNKDMKFGDMKTTASKATADAIAARTSREAKRARYGAGLGVLKEDARGVAGSVASWAGMKNIIDRVKYEEDWISKYEPYKSVFETGEYTTLTSEANKLKALKASGTQKAFEQAGYKSVAEIDAAIENIKNKQQDIRLKAIENNKEAAASVIAELAMKIKEDPSMANDLGLTKFLSVEQAESIRMDGDKIKLGNHDMSETEMQTILEGGTTSGSEGLWSSRKAAVDKKNNDTTSIAYQEYQRKQEEKK